MDALIERLRRLDPVGEQLPPPPIEGLLDRLEHHADGPAGRSPAPRIRDRRSRRMPSIGAVVTSVSVVIVVVIAIGALVLLGHHNQSPTPATSHGATPGRQELIGMLGVLRRPQTKTDIDPGLVRLINQRQSQGLPQGTVDVPLMRRVVTSWGENLYLVAFRPPTAAALRAVWERMRPPRPALREFIAGQNHETLGLFTSNGGGGGGQTAADIQYLGSDAYVGARLAGLRPSQGGYQYLIRVVPDGVTKVVFLVRGHLGRVKPGAPATPPPRTVTASVHNNIAAARITRPDPAGSFEAIWYGTGGKVLKRSFWP